MTERPRPAGRAGTAPPAAACALPATLACVLTAERVLALEATRELDTKALLVLATIVCAGVRACAAALGSRTATLLVAGNGGGRGGWRRLPCSGDVIIVTGSARAGPAAVGDLRAGACGILRGPRLAGGC